MYVLLPAKGKKDCLVFKNLVFPIEKTDADLFPLPYLSDGGGRVETNLLLLQ